MEQLRAERSQTRMRAERALSWCWARLGGSWCEWIVRWMATACSYLVLSGWGLVWGWDWGLALFLVFVFGRGFDLGLAVSGSVSIGAVSPEKQHDGSSPKNAISLAMMQCVGSSRWMEYGTMNGTSSRLSAALGSFTTGNSWDGSPGGAIPKDAGKPTSVAGAGT